MSQRSQYISGITATVYDNTERKVKASHLQSGYTGLIDVVYTKEELDVMLTGVTVDLSGYWNSGQTIAYVDEHSGSTVDLTGYATTGYSYSKAESDGKYLTGFTVDLSNYFTSGQTTELVISASAATIAYIESLNYLTGFTVDYSPSSGYSLSLYNLSTGYTDTKIASLQSDSSGFTLQIYNLSTGYTNIMTSGKSDQYWVSQEITASSGYSLSLYMLATGYTNTMINSAITYLLDEIPTDYVDLTTNQIIEGQKTFRDIVIVCGTTLGTQTLQVKDNFILINSGETGSGVTAGYAGILVDRGTSTPYLIEWNETKENFRVGETGSTVALAGREDNPLDGGVAIWNDTTKIFESQNIDNRYLSAATNLDFVPIGSGDYLSASTQYEIPNSPNYLSATTSLDFVPIGSENYLSATTYIPTDNLFLSANTAYEIPNSPNYLSANTSLNFEPLNSGKYLSATTYIPADTNFLSANTSYYTQEQANNNFLSANTTVTVTVSMTGLTDVNLTSPSAGQALIYDGEYWVNSGITGGSGDLTNYYTKAETNSSFLSATTIVTAASISAVTYSYFSTKYIDFGDVNKSIMIANTLSTYDLNSGLSNLAIVPGGGFNDLNSTGRLSDKGVFLGSGVGNQGVGGKYNVGIGYAAIQSVNGNLNIGIGSNAGSGLPHTQPIGHNNVYIGNVLGTNGESGKLYIGNSGETYTTDILITGDFYNKTLNVNGDFKVNNENIKNMFLSATTMMTIDFFFLPV